MRRDERLNMHNELAAIVGKEWVHPGSAMPEYAVDGIAPQVVLSPGSVDELVEVLRRAHEARWIVVPAGFGTGLGLGNPLSRVDVVITTRRLDRLVAYEPADLTVSVEAGCSLARLNQILGERGQWLPLNPPKPERATLGAIAAVEDFGSLRLGFGLTRDYVIGVTLVQADGTIIKSGGRVVKNVAGYDLNKLFVGSHGTLGIITRLNFKLRPRPEADVTYALWGGDLAHLGEAAGELARSELAPVALNLLLAEAVRRCWASWPADGPVLLVRFMDSDPVVQYQIGQLRQWIAGIGLDASPVDDEAAVTLWRAIDDFPVDGGDVILRMSVPRSEAFPMVDIVQRTLSAAADDVAVLAYVGNGTIWVSAGCEDTEAACSRLVASLKALRRECERRSGHLILYRAPRALKRELDVWGDVGATAGLMRALKRQFDPHGILNPGRFVAGI